MWQNEANFSDAQTSGNGTSETGESGTSDNGVAGELTVPLATLTPGELEARVFKNKTDILESLDSMMEVLYVRALKHAETYFQHYREYLGTDYETNLRPRIRWRKGRPVELAWVTKIITKAVASRDDVRRYTRRGSASDGTLTRIVWENNQALRVQETFKFIARGKGVGYPISIFRKEPGWVQIEGRNLEETFTRLRQEMNLIKEMRSRISSIHVIDVKCFEATEDFHYLPSRENGITPRDYMTRIYAESDSGEESESDNELRSELPESYSEKKSSTTEHWRDEYNT